MAIKHIELMVVFTLSLNLFAGMLITSGASAAIGLGGQTIVGGDEAAQEANESMRNVSSGAPTGSTLFGMYNVLANTLSAVRTLAYAAPVMLGNLGTPGFITGPLYALITLVYGLGIIRFLRGV